MSDPTINKYPNYVNKVTRDLLPRATEWSIAERTERQAPTHNSNTNNYVEVSMRFSKDKQFHRSNGLNMGDALGSLLDQSEPYARKAIDMGNARSAWLKNN